MLTLMATLMGMCWVATQGMPCFYGNREDFLFYDAASHEHALLLGAQPDPWACPNPPNRHYTFLWRKGLVSVYRTKEDADANRPLPYRTVSYKQYVEDLNRIEGMVDDGPL